MTVTGIERKGKKKIRVCIDYEFAFEGPESMLYSYSLSEGSEIDGELYEKIMKEEVYPAAKKKAMDLLIKSDKSEYMLKRKLLESFCEEAAEAAMDYVKSFGYVDDRRYAREYYLSHKGRHSFMQIQYVLRQNGVSKEDIDAALLDVSSSDGYPEGEALDETDGVDYIYERELEAARAFLLKKGVEFLDDLGFEERGKAIAALKRKGFSSAVIRKL